MLVGSYDPNLVLVSLAVAILASYTALGLVSRANATRGKVSLAWLLGGGCALGLGIWSMHFVGMLAFRLPIPLGYDLGLTILSLLIAIACSACALWMAHRAALPRWRMACAALQMGAGIAAMHYVGMAAMRMSPAIEYSPWLFALSIVIAVVASGTALSIAHKQRRNRSNTAARRLRGSLVMGLAIVGMHYTGMTAARIADGAECLAVLSGISPGWLATGVTGITLSVLSIALAVAVLDTRLETRTSALAASLAQANQELMHLALHDTLTKLPNRAQLDDRLRQAISRADTRHSRFAVLFIDLDGFKAVNDAYGHRCGDGLLRELAHRIKDEVARPGDTVARLGGDEFVLVADVAAPADSALIAQKLIAALSRDTHVDGHTLCVTASVGIAIHPEDGKDGHTLLTHADAAMYHAKRQGGARRFSYFESTMNEDARRQLQLVQDLRQARERGELLLHYQPKFLPPTGPAVGAEALLRWNHPRHGVIPPGDFIPLAERTGLIFPIGDWVLNEACRQLRIWRDLGHTNWNVSVNLSAMQFAHPGLLETIQGALARHLVPPSCLTIEITETTAMRDAVASIEVLRKLTALGVSISIDDFGTGYSNLLYLKQLPANELKIDRSFIDQLEHSQEDAAIVSAIIALGQRLNLRIVAEGVETAGQQRLLTELGCNSVQGFLLGKPVPASEFPDVAQAWHPVLAPSRLPRPTASHVG
ncbi:bifunctional diguanylate cyclase/phosphodiesterase [Pigmentiphaga sp. H8]|uniref:putative bifunctional diguanylate cyclase/phosphodiesterase n=1 Tax=Pigmentiphaga sp. H8 TaxID=2488560 RepID=UPI000F5AE4D2|nr:bifunctional diguanylate cyclase/phosphodiesterase [Pigmentiphaga sp. H8]AZG07742.1 bifunctional diguanylate cyclase/phosphodiesterase [Pigmentiphaga sp. H8]